MHLLSHASRLGRERVRRIFSEQCQMLVQVRAVVVFYHNIPLPIGVQAALGLGVVDATREDPAPRSPRILRGLDAHRNYARHILKKERDVARPSRVGDDEDGF